VPKRAYAARLPPDQRRQQLLDEALLLINEGGLSAVTVDAVARRCGVTRPVVYGVFDDACHLLRELLDREARAALAEFQAQLPALDPDEDPAQVATKTFDALIAAMLANPDRWRTVLLPTESTPPQLRKHVQDGRSAVLSQFTEFATWATRKRGLDVDTELLGRVLLAWVAESGRLVLSDPENYPPERLSGFAKSLCDLVFSGS
jgi:AcrR family transcriptional regulator